MIEDQLTRDERLRLEALAQSINRSATSGGMMMNDDPDRLPAPRSTSSSSVADTEGHAGVERFDVKVEATIDFSAEQMAAIRQMAVDARCSVTDLLEAEPSLWWRMLEEADPMITVENSHE